MDHLVRIYPTFFIYKWFLHGPVRTKTQVDCARPRVKLLFVGVTDILAGSIKNASIAKQLFFEKFIKLYCDVRNFHVIGLLAVVLGGDIFY